MQIQIDKHNSLIFSLIKSTFVLFCQKIAMAFREGGASQSIWQWRKMFSCGNSKKQINQTIVGIPKHQTV